MVEKKQPDFKKEFKNRQYQFTLKLIKCLEEINNEFISKRLADQLIRSGTSIMANYIEGQYASSEKDLINYLNHCIKSCNESMLWISLLKDSNRLKKEDCDWFIKEITEFAKIFTSSKLTLKSKNSKS